MMTELYNPLSDYLKSRFGCKVRKVSINAGFTCPNRDGTKGRGGCIYCEPKALIQGTYSKGMGVKEQLALGIEGLKAAAKADKVIAYFQINTNTYAPIEYLKALYTEAIEHPDVVCLAISARPDCVGDDVVGLLKTLKEKKHLWVELGLQSANDKTLEYIGRGHTVKDFSDAASRLHKAGIDIVAHMMIGLPAEGRDDILNTVRFINNCGVWGLKFHQLEVVKGTRLEEAFTRGEVRVLSLEEYKDLVIECLENLCPESVVHKLVGYTPDELLIAPKWGAGKHRLIDLVKAGMLERHTHQGAKYNADSR